MSFKICVANSSIITADEIAHQLIINIAGDSVSIITEVVIKNAIEPSNDLLKSFVFPNFIPTIAAAESDKLITSKEIIAIFSLNKNKVRAAPIKTHDAPEILVIS